MRYLPNLIIAGAQKSGTTWLHFNLKKSSNFFGSEVKELNFFNQKNAVENVSSYTDNFVDAGAAKYIYETTPGYFQLPSGGVDTARNIKEVLGCPKVIVILRNPIERYESAYIHHMMRGRIEYTPVIEEVNYSLNMLSLGMYGSILGHWKDIFPGIGVFFYDDLEKDPNKFIEDVFKFLEVENDLKNDSSIGLKIHDRERKAKKRSNEWVNMPKLSTSLTEKLYNIYRDDIHATSLLTGRNLDIWKRPQWKG